MCWKGPVLPHLIHACSLTFTCAHKIIEIVEIACLNGEVGNKKPCYQIFFIYHSIFSYTLQPTLLIYNKIHLFPKVLVKDLENVYLIIFFHNTFLDFSISKELVANQNTGKEILNWLKQ